ncbi:hypothetical protein [Polyangium sp. 15x6]|uniref:hypothetical protein n=1 Tax=Polyangium sp. 15x6 TaxID=3042687 RepID=UPI00249B8551|nr:hypothetical protein [Polyangium sp. 15x6]MDI3287493.1 hypothetical protein [Polyangium sp. 15x6]
MISRRSTLLATAAGALFLSAGQDARALDIAGTAIRPDGALVVVFWDETLPQNSSVRYSLVSKVTARFVCSVPWTAITLSEPSTQIFRDILQTVTLRADASGNLEGIITTSALAAPPLQCPFRLVPTVDSVRHEDIILRSPFGEVPVPSLFWERHPGNE